MINVFIYVHVLNAKPHADITELTKSFKSSPPKKMHIDLLTFVGRYLCLIISVSVSTVKFQLYENKKYLNVPRGILHVTSRKCNS